MPAGLAPLPAGRAGQPARPGAVAGRSGEPADGPRHGQPLLAEVLRHRPGEDRRGLRRPGRAAQPPRIARLAGRRVRATRGWDVKALHRLIVTSATYRQSSRVTPELLRARPGEPPAGPRPALPAVVAGASATRRWRVSGLLVEKLGGPPVKPYQPPGIWEEMSFGQHPLRAGQGRGPATAAASTRSGGGPSGRRDLFDTPPAQVCAVRQARTNTPLHALITAQRRDLRRGRPRAGPAPADARPARPGASASPAPSAWRRPAGRPTRERQVLAGRWSAC